LGSGAAVQPYEWKRAIRFEPKTTVRTLTGTVAIPDLPSLGAAERSVVSPQEVAIQGEDGDAFWTRFYFAKDPLIAVRDGNQISNDNYVHDIIAGCEFSNDSYAVFDQQSVWFTSRGPVQGYYACTVDQPDVGAISMSWKRACPVVELHQLRVATIEKNGVLTVSHVAIEKASACWRSMDITDDH
jgi:hypothetical protein